MINSDNVVRGEKIYYTDGELAFDMAINTKANVGTHVGRFLEKMDDHDACGETYSKILNVNDKIEIVSDKLLNRFHI
jgi:hypothetical protein